MKKIITTGIICFKDKCGILYKVSKIEYVEYENEEYAYTFVPYYNVIDFLPSSLFQGIPGLDLSLRKERYERKNTVPVFISERTPSQNREDVRELLEENGMESLNRLEWLIRAKTKYSGDDLFVLPYEGNEVSIYKKHSMYDLVMRSDDINRTLLSIVCAGDYLHADDIALDDSTRAIYYRLLIALYTKEYNSKRRAIQRGIEAAKARSAYKGRKKAKIDPLLFEETLNNYASKKLSSEKAAKQLGISKATFFRRLKEKAGAATKKV
jgi:predicted DNA-binding protein (UPF0251 family)